MDVVSGWVHQDGTECSEYLAPADNREWWCTTHQQRVSLSTTPVETCHPIGEVCATHGGQHVTRCTTSGGLVGAIPDVWRNRRSLTRDELIAASEVCLDFVTEEVMAAGPLETGVDAWNSPLAALELVRARWYVAKAEMLGMRRSAMSQGTGQPVEPAQIVDHRSRRGAKPGTAIITLADQPSPVSAPIAFEEATAFGTSPVTGVDKRTLEEIAAYNRAHPSLRRVRDNPQA